MKKLLLYFFLTLVPFFAVSQIQINEVFADNGDCCLDDSLETEDFLELIGNPPHANRKNDIICLIQPGNEPHNWEQIQK